MRNKIVLFLLVVIIIAVGLYLYTYKGHREISTEKSDFHLTVNELVKEFGVNDSLANHKYTDKTVEISGKITSIDVVHHIIIIDEKIAAVLLDSMLPKITPEDSIKVKGRFVGYDDLLEEFKIDQVTIIQ